MDAMKSMPDNWADLAIVDPPYGIGNWVQITGKVNKIHTHGEVTWNENIPPPEYFNELRRVSVEQIIWGANYYNCFNDKGGAIIWDKKNPNPQFSACEIASYSRLKRVAYVRIDHHGSFIEKSFHPCQKPVKLYDWLLTNYAEPGQRILDTHLGSGSSAIAAHYFGCDFVGCEIDEDYHKAACERFDKETRQLDLLGEL